MPTKRSLGDVAREPDAAEKMVNIFDTEMEKLVAMEESAPAQLTAALHSMQNSLSRLTSDRSDIHARRESSQNA